MNHLSGNEQLLCVTDQSRVIVAANAAFMDALRLDAAGIGRTSLPSLLGPTAAAELDTLQSAVPAGSGSFKSHPEHADTSIEWTVLTHGSHMILAGTRATPNSCIEEFIRNDPALLGLLFSQTLEGIFFMMLDEPLEWGRGSDEDRTTEFAFTHQRITEANSTMLRQYGASREKLIGLTPADLYAHDPEGGKRLWRTLLENGQLHIEAEERTVDGRTIWIEADHLCLYDTNRRIIGSFGIQRDITARHLAEQELRRTSEELSGFFEVNLDLLCIADMQGRFLKLNREWERALGYSLRELEGLEFVSLVHPDDTTATLAAVDELNHGREIINFRNRYRRKDGLYRWIEWRSIPVGNRIFAAALDITDSVAAEEELRQSRLSLELALWGADLGTWDWNIATGEFRVNARWTEMLGYRHDEIEPRIAGWEKLIHPDDLPFVSESLQRHIAGDSQQYENEHRMRNSQGEWIWILTRGRVTERDANGAPIRACGTHLDINSRKKLEFELEHLAHYDRLTGLTNRVLFFDRLNQTITQDRRNQRTFALLYVDLDGFKEINDTWGHARGDELLQAVSERIRDCIRESDTAARIGGDEFTIILRNIITRDDAGRVAGKMLRELSRPFDIENGCCTIGASIGIALFPDHGETSTELLRNADAAMYKIKHAGKNSYAFYVR